MNCQKKCYGWLKKIKKIKQQTVTQKNYSALPPWPLSGASICVHLHHVKQQQQNTWMMHGQNVQDCVTRAHPYSTVHHKMWSVDRAAKLYQRTVYRGSLVNTYPSQCRIRALGEYSCALPPNLFNLGTAPSLQKKKKKKSDTKSYYLSLL